MAESLPLEPEFVSPSELAPFRQFLLDFFSSPPAAIALVIFIAIVVAAILAPTIAPQEVYNLAVLDIMDSNLPPGAEAVSGSMRYWLGTDDQGRDLVSAILFGLRTSLMVGAASCALAFVIGSSLGLLAAYRGGWFERALMRLVDLQLSFPSMLVALILVATLGQGIGKIIAALVAVQWAYYARTIRASALVEREKDYVSAVRCLGLGATRIVFRHLLPNCLPPLIVVATVQVGQAIALEATLSFLGIGLPITRPSLGLLISNGFDYLLTGKYWISTFPGVALLVLLIAINVMGDHLRDILNPRLAK
jgi:peptide/nickel transport system permease protein